MRPYVIQIAKGLMAAAALFLLLRTFGPQQWRPILSVSDEIDLGTKKSGELVSFKIQVRNHGLVTAKIEGVNSSCGCTIVSLPALEIGGWSTIQLEGEVNLSGKIGDFSERVMVFPDPELLIEALPVRIHGKVVE